MFRVCFVTCAGEAGASDADVRGRAGGAVRAAGTLRRVGARVHADRGGETERARAKGGGGKGDAGEEPSRRGHPGVMERMESPPGHEEESQEQQGQEAAQREEGEVTNRTTRWNLIGRKGFFESHDKLRFVSFVRLFVCLMNFKRQKRTTA